MKRTVICALVASWAAPGLSANAADPVLDILFYRRPPLYYSVSQGDSGEEYKGIVLEKVQAALAEAGIAARFREIPTKRLVAIIRSGQPATCGMAYFKTPEREAFAKFSQSLFRDKPWVVIAQQANLPRLAAANTMQNLLADRSLTPSLIDGISYGTYIDRLLANAKVDKAAIDVETAMRKIEAGHGSYTILPTSAFDYYRTRTNPATQLRALVFPDVRPGENLYLMCSQAVPDDLLNRFNAALGDR